MKKIISYSHQPDPGVQQAWTEVRDFVHQQLREQAERYEYAVMVALAEGRHGVRVMPDGRAYPSGTIPPRGTVYEPRNW